MAKRIVVEPLKSFGYLVVEVCKVFYIHEAHSVDKRLRIAL